MKKEAQFHIVRADKAGVFLCRIKSIGGPNGDSYKVTNLRRLYRWSGALDVTMIALEGVANPSSCTFSVQLGDEGMWRWIGGQKINLDQCLREARLYQKTNWRNYKSLTPNTTHENN